MIKFKKLLVKGYGSIIHETKIKLDRPGVNIVIGEIGVGKTTMFSPLRWVISGKSLKGTRDVATYEHLRPKDWDGTHVTLFFQKDGEKFELTRGVKGRKQILTLTDSAGKNYLTGQKIKNQETIFEFLGLNDEVLVNSIIFGQRMKRLIESSGPDKKKLFEEAFNASFLKDGREAAKADLDIEKDNLSNLTHNQDILKEKLKGSRLLIAQVKEQRANFKKKQKEAKDNLNKKLKAIEKTYDSLFDEASIVKKINKHKHTLNSIQSEYYQKLADNRSAEGKLEKAKRNHKKALADKKELEADFNEIYEKGIEVSESKKCEYCGGKLSDINHARALKRLEKTKKGIEAKLYSTETAVLEFAADVEKLTLSSKKSPMEVLDELEAKRKDYDKRIASLEKKNFNQRIAKEQIKSIKASLKELENNTPPPTPQRLILEMMETEAEVANNEIIIEQLETKIEDLNWVYNDLLGNKGLKSYIFDTMLLNLNNLLVYYEQFIGFRVEFKVDLDSGNKDIYTVCYRDGHLAYYEDLSGGQKQLVDAVTTFALYELIAQDKPTNLMILDEPFDGLSETASELIFELIQDKNKGDKSIFIITHNLSLQNSSDKVIRVGFDNGHTKLKIL